jgi:2-polyprenyl-3-methyl-5-hydroxy-6-metoxy-1,4-benzoquinol methylase
MSSVPMQTRFPRLWLAAQQLIGGTRDKSALVLRHYSGQIRVLEVGCSLGNISDAFRSFDCISYKGIDIDASAIAIARRRFSDRSNFSFETTPIEELAEKGEQYDYVIVAGVLHHLDDRSALRMIACSWAVTEPGGILVASEPAALQETDGLVFRLFYRLEEGQFLREKNQLVGLFKAANVPLSSVEDHTVTPGIVSWPPVARFNLLRADRDETQ